MKEISQVIRSARPASRLSRVFHILCVLAFQVVSEEVSVSVGEDFASVSDGADEAGWTVENDAALDSSHDPPPEVIRMLWTNARGVGVFFQHIQVGVEKGAG